MMVHKAMTVTLLCGLLALAGCGNNAGSPGELALADKTTTIPLPSTDADVTIDGVLDDAAWKHAVALGDFVLGDDAKPLVDTRVLVTYDRNNLYVAFICQEPATDRMISAVYDRDGDVWTDDSVELALDVNNTKSGEYYQFIVSSANIVYDRDKEGPTWTGLWRHATKVTPGVQWVAELAFPFTTLGIRPTPESKLGLMAARNRYAQGDSQGMFLVPCEREIKDTQVYPVLMFK